MVSLAELPVGQEALTGQPITDLGGVTPLVSAPETISTYDFGGSLAASQSIFSQAASVFAAQKAEEARLRQYQANQQQAQWAAQMQAEQQSFLKDLAESYTDYYEEATPTERIVDTAAEIGTGLATETSNLITESVSTIGETIVQPIASEGADVLKDLAIPIALVGGAILLLK